MHDHVDLHPPGVTFDELLRGAAVDAAFGAIAYVAAA
jgi:hypothetical protein